MGFFHFPPLFPSQVANTKNNVLWSLKLIMKKSRKNEKMNDNISIHWWCKPLKWKTYRKYDTQVHTSCILIIQHINSKSPNSFNTNNYLYCSGVQYSSNFCKYDLLWLSLGQKDSVTFFSSFLQNFKHVTPVCVYACVCVFVCTQTSQ